MDSTKVIVAVVLVLLLGGGAYFYFQNKDGEMNDDQPVGQNQMMQASPVQSPSMSASDNAMMASDSGMMGAVKEVTVEGSSFKFVPATISVNKGDKVKITFKNTGGFHDFVIDGMDVRTKQIGAGASDTVEFTADKAGTFEYYCSVGNHRGMGMKGTLTVK